MTLSMMTCEVCGTECERRGGRQRFCEGCREAGNTLLRRERDLRRRPPKTKIGEIIACERCGVDVIRKQAKQKRCADCLGPHWVEHRSKKTAAVLAEKGIVVGEAFPCGMCGMEIVRKNRHHKYCEPCADVSKDQSTTQYRNRNREKLNTSTKEWRETDSGREWVAEYRSRPSNRVHSNMSRAIRASIAGKGGRSWELLLGYSTEQLMAHIEKQFLQGMSWENYGDWHIDHIRPKASFDFASVDDQAFQDCWSLTNLRPLWAEDNRRKSAKLAFLI